MLWLLSMRFRSSSMYSASAASGLFARYVWMSSRTLESKFARFLASCSADRNRPRSRLCSASFSRRSERLFCLRAEDVRLASESKRRASWLTTLSLLNRSQKVTDKSSGLDHFTFSSISSNFSSVSRSSLVGFAGMLATVENCEYVWKRVSVYKS